MFALLVQAFVSIIKHRAGGVLFIGERFVPWSSPTGLASKPIDICLLAPIGPTVGPS